MSFRTTGPTGHSNNNVFSYQDETASLSSEQSLLQDVKSVSLSGQISLQKIGLNKIQKEVEKARWVNYGNVLEITLKASVSRNKLNFLKRRTNPIFGPLLGLSMLGKTVKISTSSFNFK